MIVADASLVVDALVTGGRHGDGARALLAAQEAHAPHLLDAEVASALRLLNLGGALDDTQASQALDDLIALPIVRYPHEPLLARAWARRRALSLYDALYVALAESLDLPLATTDARLARSLPPGARVELVGAEP